MNFSRVIAFARETQALEAQLVQAQAEQDRLRAFARLAQAQGNLEQAKKVADNRKIVDSAVEGIGKVLCEHTHTNDVDRAREYVTDLLAKVRVAEEHYVQWREKKASFELRVEVESGIDRAQEEQILEAAKRRFEIAVRLAGDMIPEKPVVLLP